MKNVKLLSIVTTCVLSISILTGCGTKVIEAFDAKPVEEEVIMTTKDLVDTNGFERAIDNSFEKEETFEDADDYETDDEMFEEDIYEEDEDELEEASAQMNLEPINMNWREGLSDEERDEYFNEHFRRGCFDYEEFYGTYLQINRKTGELFETHVDNYPLNDIENGLEFNQEFIDSMDEVVFDKEAGYLVCKGTKNVDGKTATFKYTFNMFEQDGVKLYGISIVYDPDGSGMMQYNSDVVHRLIEN